MHSYPHELVPRFSDSLAPNPLPVCQRDLGSDKAKIVQEVEFTLGFDAFV